MEGDGDDNEEEGREDVEMENNVQGGNLAGDASEPGGDHGVQLQLQDSGRVPHSCHFMNALIKSYQHVDVFGRHVSPFKFEVNFGQSISFKLYSGMTTRRRCWQLCSL